MMMGVDLKRLEQEEHYWIKQILGYKTQSYLLTRERRIEVHFKTLEGFRFKFFYSIQSPISEVYFKVKNDGSLRVYHYDSCNIYLYSKTIDVIHSGQAFEADQISQEEYSKWLKNLKF